MEIRKKLFGMKKIITVMLLLSLILPGCSKQKEGVLPAAKNEGAMGRYVETEISFPEPLTYVQGMTTLANGEIKLLGMAENTEGGWQFKIFSSKDKGQTWESELPSWLKELEESDEYYGITAGAWDQEGGFYLCYDKMETGSEERESGIIYVDPLGKSTKLPFEIPADDGGSGVKGLQIAKNGDLLFDCWFSIIQLDGKTGELKYTYRSSDGSSINSSVVFDDILYMTDGDTVLSYSLKDGSSLETISCVMNDSASGTGEDSYVSYSNMPENSRLLSVDKNGVLFFADNSGIFRCPDGNTILERIVDGSLTSLPAPTLSRFSMVTLDDRYLVFGTKNEGAPFTILSYVYSSEVPTVPSTELTVFSMKDNRTLRQAIALFQRENPDIHISYQTGFEEQGTTDEDTLRTFSTQLLAGKGPDILVLDGMPVDSYMEKGILLDLSDTVGTRIASGELLTNAANTYLKKDGTLLAIPARFQVPMMQGNPGTGNSIQSLSDLVAQMEKEKDQYFSPLSNVSAQIMLDSFFPVCAPVLTDENGLVKEEELSAFLASLKRIQDLKTGQPDMDTFDSESFNFDFGCLIWMKQAAGFNIGTLTSFTALYSTWQAMDEREGECSTLLNQNLFLPSTILGVNAKSSQPDLAGEFINFILSEQVLSADLHDGLPVVTKAFDSQTEPPVYKEGERFGNYGTSYTDAGGTEQSVFLTIFYPPKEYTKNMAALFTSLKPAPAVDQTVLSIITEGSAGYFSGTQALNTAVSGIMQKLKLYQSE